MEWLTLGTACAQGLGVEGGEASASTRRLHVGVGVRACATGCGSCAYTRCSREAACSTGKEHVATGWQVDLWDSTGDESAAGRCGCTRRDTYACEVLLVWQACACITTALPGPCNQPQEARLQAGGTFFVFSRRADGYGFVQQHSCSCAEMRRDTRPTCTV